jgi:hypothetical protein
MWSALEIPSERAAVEYEDRQQIMATFSNAVPEAVGAFLEKRPASFADLRSASPTAMSELFGAGSMAPWRLYGALARYLWPALTRK